MNNFLQQREYDWTKPTNLRAYQLLVSAFPTVGEGTRIASAVGFPGEIASEHEPSGPFWRTLLDRAAAAGSLPMLIAHVMSILVASDRPDMSVLGNQLAAIMAGQVIDSGQLEGPTIDEDSEQFNERRWLASLWPIGRDPEDDETVSVERAREIFEEKFCNPRSSTRIPVNPQQISKVEPIVEGKAFRFDLLEYGVEGRCTAQMYLDLAEVAGRLWTQEANALVRLSARRHQAFPEVVDGMYRDQDGIGIVVSKSGELFDLKNVHWLRATPNFGLRCFEMLADALRCLHGHGMMHRAIWRGTLELVRNEHDVPVGVRLTRFEMSAFLASILDPAWRSSPRERSAMKRYYLRGGAASLLACPPERLGPLLGIERDRTFEEYRSDIYSLGIVAYEWFVGDLPVEAFARKLGNRVEDVTPTRFRGAYQVLEEQIIQARHLPRALKELLREMLGFDRTPRPTSFDVVSRLATEHEDIVYAWNKKNEERLFLVSIAPQQMTEHVRVAEWQGLHSDPDIRFDQLKRRIERDLAPACLVHEPAGAGEFVDGGDPVRQAESTYVLLGMVAVYFCQVFSRAGKQSDWVLHINYAVDKSTRRVRTIACNPLQRTIRGVQVVHYQKSGDVDPKLGPRNHPLWTPLLKEVTLRSRPPDWHRGFKAGLNWWLSLQRATTEVRYYAYEKVQNSENDIVGGRRTVRLRVDTKRDRRWIEIDEMRYIVSSERPRRPDFGDFFDTLDERELESHVTWLRDQDGRPAGREDGQSAPSGRIRSRVNSGEIIVEVLGKEFPPRLGWLRPMVDVPSDVLLDRQVKARESLYASPQLLNALYEPWSIRGSRVPWARAGAQLSEEGRGREILKDMLATFPFYVLQGPPGTGKTTIVVNAVLEFLKWKPSARILVSAQSHYALDELAGRIMESLDRSRAPYSTKDSSKPTDWEEGWSGDGSTGGITLVRVVPEKAEPLVSERSRALGDAEQAVKCLQQIERLPHQREIREEFSEALKEIAVEWKRAARSSLSEIRDHIWRGANVIFATCGTSTEYIVGIQADIDRFDWVVVEEAGKAWPAELAMPLVHGWRWTLIGDPKQLPPFGKEHVKRIYERWKRASRQQQYDSFAGDEAFEATFDLLGRLFERAKEAKLEPQRGNPDRDNADIYRRRPWPVDMLNLQFRMHEHIARIVSDVFYDREIETCSALQAVDPSHDLSRPDFLASRTVAWLDTGRVGVCRYEEPRWRNCGEVEVVAAMLEQAGDAVLWPDPDQRLAILSPYHAQNDLLGEKLPEKYRRLIHTTDSFQGREADVVVVSLVRTNDLKRIGHLADEQRMNVLLSRARKLLVLVGDFEHFNVTADTKWPAVCRIIEELKGRIPSSRVSQLLGG